MSATQDCLTYLSRGEVTGLMPSIEEQLNLIERTYQAIALGNVEMPPKPGIHPRKNAFIHAMPAYLGDDDVAAIKWVSGYPDNGKFGLPYISALIVVNDAETGRPLAVMDGAEITAARTAGASGVCIRQWAPTGWNTVGILGCGEQGSYHARVVNALNPDAKILAYDPDPTRVATLTGDVTPVSDPREAYEQAEIVITAGPIVEHPEPVIDAGALAERCLLLPLDFDFYTRAGAISSADMFLVDDVPQYDYYRGNGHFQDWPDPVDTVGGRLGTAAAGNRVACVNLGVGALDAAYANVIQTQASKNELGTILER